MLLFFSFKGTASRAVLSVSCQIDKSGPEKGFAHGFFYFAEPLTYRIFSGKCEFA
jgi:hypothetical protein